MSAANDCTLDALVGRGFDLLVSDPPWPVKKIVRKVRPNQIAALDYPTMTLDEIKAMPVAGCAADKAVLFLWTTHAFLRDAFAVMDAYGFRYQRTLTWDKANGMCLFGFHHRTEFCLFGYRGKIEMYPRRRAIPTVFSGKSERHSAKPDEFYHMVEPLGVNRLDIFARRQREGWTCWGNEVRGSCDECEKSDNCAKTKAEDCQWLIQANPSLQGTGHLVDRTLQGVVQIQNKQEE